MNKTIKKFLLAGENKKIKETRDSRYFYHNELDKACFQLDMAYVDVKDLNRRTAADKLLRDKAFNIAKTSNYDGYQHGLASTVYKFFDKKNIWWICYARK